MEPRLSLITLGVADVSVSRAFYEALGFKASPASTAGVAFFRAGAMVLSLYDRRDLAKDLGRADVQPANGAINLAHNTRSEEEVDSIIAKAAQCGAKVLKTGTATSWGGYCGYFCDPDGHVWEIAYNPAWPLDDMGTLQLP